MTNRKFYVKKIDWDSWLDEQSMGWVSAPLVSQQVILFQTTTHKSARGTLNPRVLSGHLVIQLETNFPASVVIQVVI